MAEYHEPVLAAFYALANSIIDGRQPQQAQVTRTALDTGEARLRITVNLNKPPDWRAHLLESDGQRVLLAAGGASDRPEAIALMEAMAPFLTAMLADLGDDHRAQVGALLAHAHYFRIRCDISVDWRIMVSVRRVGNDVTGETHVATFSMASDQSGPQVAESATVH